MSVPTVLVSILCIFLKFCGVLGKHLCSSGLACQGSKVSFLSLRPCHLISGRIGMGHILATDA